MVENWLLSRGVPFMRNRPIVCSNGKTKFVDFFIYHSKTFLEIDGIEHDHEKDIDREAMILHKRGKRYNFVRVGNWDIEDKVRFEETKKFLRVALRLRKTKEEKKEQKERIDRYENLRHLCNNINNEYFSVVKNIL